MLQLPAPLTFYVMLFVPNNVPAIPLVVYAVVVMHSHVFELTCCLGIAVLLLNAGEPKCPRPSTLPLRPYCPSTFGPHQLKHRESKGYT
jgi:hypothetical protein